MPSKIQAIAFFAALTLGSRVLAAEVSGAKFDALSEKISQLSSMGQCSFPTFSPDGSQLAFVSNLSGTEQIWTVPVTGGWPNQVTAAEALVGAVWCPTSDKIAFMAGTGSRQLYTVNADGTGLKQIAAGDNQISNWSSNGKKLFYSSNPGGKRLAPCVADIETGLSKPLLADEDLYFVNDVTADGKTALATLWNGNSDCQMYLIDLATRNKTLLTDDTQKALYSGGGINRSVPAFSSDATEVYCVTNYQRTNYAFAKINTKPRDSEKSKVEFIAAQPGNCVGFCLNRQHSVAATVWRADSGDSISLIDLRSGKTNDLAPLPAASCAELEFSPDGNTFALSLIDSNVPQDIWLYHIKERTYQKLTHSEHPGINLQSLVKAEIVNYKGSDGKDISAWLYKPKIQNARKPFVIACSGGTSHVEPEFQALLTLGIGVIAPKIRESGVDSKQNDLISGAALRTESDDIRSCATYLTSNGLANPQHIGIMGFSHGARVTLVGLTECPDLFAAGVVHAGVVDYATYIKDSNPTRKTIFDLKIENEKDKAKAMENLSPIFHLNRVKAPVMVQQGANDAQIPASQSDELVQALRKQGTTVEYIQFPDEGHWLHKYANRVKSATEMVRFLDSHLNK